MKTPNWLTGNLRPQMVGSKIGSEKGKEEGKKLKGSITPNEQIAKPNSFEVELRLSAMKTEQHIWYPVYLFTEL